MDSSSDAADSPEVRSHRKFLGNHQSAVEEGRRQQADQDARRATQEPERGYRAASWNPPADWGSFEVTLPTLEMTSPILGVAYEILFFPKTHRFVNRFTLPIYGWN